MVNMPTLALIVLLGSQHHMDFRSQPPVIWTSALAFSHHVILQTQPASPTQTPTRRGHSGIWYVAVGAAIGAAAAGTTGYVLTRKCVCDDPGYGLLIGVPLGAAVGAVGGAIVAGHVK